MRHRRRRGKLGVTTNHRKALLRNLIRGLVVHKRIRTTLAKAKEASSFADQMVQLAKRTDLHARRLLISRLGCPQTARVLMTQIAPHFKDRKGGYTRVLRFGTRAGDGAELALLEFTATIAVPEKVKKPKKEKAPKEEKKAKEAKPEKTAPSRHEESAPERPKKKEAESKKPEEQKEGKKESEKKGGFLSALRKFLKGDEESK